VVFCCCFWRNCATDERTSAWNGLHYILESVMPFLQVGGACFSLYILLGTSLMTYIAQKLSI